MVAVGIVSLLVLGGTFLLTWQGVFSGATLATIYITYAGLLAVGMIAFALFDRRAAYSHEDAARITRMRKAARALAVHRAGVARGTRVRVERARFYRRDCLMPEALEHLLVDDDPQTRALTGALLVEAGAPVVQWAEERLEALEDDPDAGPLRTALERIVRHAPTEPDDVSSVFR